LEPILSENGHKFDLCNVASTAQNICGPHLSHPCFRSLDFDLGLML
jgi:hypothetical protein